MEWALLGERVVIQPKLCWLSPDRDQKKKSRYLSVHPALEECGKRCGRDPWEEEQVVGVEPSEEEGI